MRPLGRPSAPVASGALRNAVEGVAEPLSGRTLGDLGLVDEEVLRRGGPRLRVHGITEEPGYLRRLSDLVGGVAGPGAVTVLAADEPRRHAAARVLRSGYQRPGVLGSPTSVYAVASGKGGVGKSTVTANLAAALALQGRRVGVLDADVWGYSQPTLFGVRQAPVAVPGLMFPVESQGVRLMSVGFFVDDDEPVVWRGPMLHKALEQFLEDVYWGELDVLLVDLPPGTGDVTLSVLELLPDAAMVVVTTPQLAAESVAARVGRMARDSRMPVAGVIENMSGGAFGSGGGTALAEDIGAPLLGTVQLDGAVCAAGDGGVPLVLADPGHESARMFLDLARDLPTMRRSLVGRSLPLFVGAS
ncbi:MAG: P-loop NTPase [Marmoricola sp.]